MISVVVPAHNEAILIQNCLESLRRQQFTQPYEVIVVDNNSTDNTMATVQTYHERWPQLDLRLIEEPQVGIAQACQTGFLAARYDIIVRTDADTVVDPDWLTRLARHFAQPAVMAVGGGVRYENNGLFIWSSRTFHGWHTNWGLPYFFGTNMAIRRSAFQAIGGFNTQLQRTEDIDISRRLWERYSQQGQLIFDPAITVTTSLRKYRDWYQSWRALPSGVGAYFVAMYDYLKDRVPSLWIK